MTDLKLITGIQVNVSNARGALGIDLQGDVIPGQFLVKSIGGVRAFQAASGTGADAGLRTDLASAVGGASLVTFQQGGTSAVSRTARDKTREWITPQDFGAIADGVADDSAAIQKFLLRLSSVVPSYGRQRDGQAMGYVPAGIYRITQSGLFSPSGLAKRMGYKIIGAGRNASIFWLDCNDGTDKYFYDNGTNNRCWGNTYEGITFSGGNDYHLVDASNVALPYSNLNNHARGFRFNYPTGAGWESAHTWIDCSFRWLNDIIDAEGANNGDTHGMVRCLYDNCGRLFYVNNTQSIAFSFTDCYDTNGFGTVLEFGPNCAGGGGNFNWKGGAIIRASTSGGDAVLVSAVNGGPGASQAPIVFSNLHIELRQANNRIGQITYGSTHLVLDHCTVLNAATVAKEWVQVGGFCQFSMIGGTIFEQGGVSGTWRITGTARQGYNARIAFTRGVQLPANIHDQIVWDGGWGVLEIDDSCRGVAAQFSTQPAVIAYAAIITGTKRASSQANRTRPVAVISPIISENCLTTTAGTQALLPPRVRIRRVTAKIEPGGTGSASTMRVLIGNGDKTVIYGQSTTAAQNVGHAINVPIDIAVGTDMNKRTVTIWVDDGAGNNPSSSVVAGVLDGDVEYA